MLNEILEVPIITGRESQGRHFLENYIIHSSLKQSTIQHCEYRLNSEKTFFIYIITDLARPEDYLLADRIISKAPFSLLLIEHAQSDWATVYNQYIARYETPLFVVAEQSAGDTAADGIDTALFKEKSNVILFYNKDDEKRVKNVFKQAMQRLMELADR